jgi:hypothetical protein
MSTELSHRTEFEQVEIIDSERMTNPPGWLFSRSKCHSGRSFAMRKPAEGQT